MSDKPMSLNAYLRQIKQQLHEAGTPSWALDAELLLCHVLGEPREYLLRGEGELTSAQTQECNALIKRRIAREPISLIIGMREFWGREFKVTADTLAPRPDSETLIEAVLKYYQDKHAALQVIDLGTGTGCLLLTLLAEYQQANGLGVDISAPALKVASDNATKLGLTARVKWLNQDASHLLGESKSQSAFDVVVTNPPYIPSRDIEDLAPEVKHYEPLTALDGGDDGLVTYWQFSHVIKAVLKPEAMVFIEAGIHQSADIRKVMEEVGLKHIGTFNDLAGIERVVVLRR